AARADNRYATNRGGVLRSGHFARLCALAGTFLPLSRPLRRHKPAPRPCQRVSSSASGRQATEKTASKYAASVALRQYQKCKATPGLRLTRGTRLDNFTKNRPCTAGSGVSSKELWNAREYSCFVFRCDGGCGGEFCTRAPDYSARANGARLQHHQLLRFCEGPKGVR